MDQGCKLRQGLRGRSLVFSIGEDGTPPFPHPRRGIPQGAVLSPTLFNLAALNIRRVLKQVEDVHHLMYADDMNQCRFSAGKLAAWLYYTNKVWKCVFTNTPVAGLYLIFTIDILRVLVRILMLEFHFSMTVHLKICENTWRLKPYAKLMICSGYELSIKFFMSLVNISRLQFRSQSLRGI